MVLMISVLVVNLLTELITDYIIHYKIEISPLKYTAIAMLTLVFILVPTYSYMNGQIEIMVARLLVKGGNSFGKIIGLFITFAIIFTTLFAIYLYKWFHINLIHYLASILFK
jgi:hypothetical protein